MRTAILVSALWAVGPSTVPPDVEGPDGAGAPAPMVRPDQPWLGVSRRQANQRLGDSPPIQLAAADPPPPAEPPPVPPRPSEATRPLILAVAGMLPRHHLSRHPVDDEIGRRVVANLIEYLDANRELLTRAEVDRFRRDADRVDDQLKRGGLDAVLPLFDRVLERAERRQAAIGELLEAEPDFTMDENILADPSTAEFADDEAELRERWRKRVKFQLLQHIAAGLAPEEARRPARRHFVGVVEGYRAIDGDRVAALVLDALARAYDPHSSYISARDVEDFLIQQRQRLVGIGASLRVEDGYIRVTDVLAGGPAARDGRLKAGDRLIAVGDRTGEMVDVVGAPLKDVVARIRGAKGTTVRLRVLPEGKFEAQQYELTREVVQTLKARGAVLTGDQLPPGRSARIGFIHLPSFYGTTQESAAGDEFTASGDVRRLLEGFRREGVALVVLDLRDNGGGTLTEAIRVAGLFLGDVPVVQVKDAEGKVEAHRASGMQRAWDQPLVLLTNRVSAGAAEILAGAIQDHRRGLVIGDRTTVGYGTVQTLVDVGQSSAGVASPPKLGSLKVTTQRFYRPGGRSTQLIGITPDVVLPTVGDATESGERTYRYHLDTDSIAGTPFQTSDFGIDDALVKPLADRSAARREGAPYFRDLQERIDRLRQRQAVGVVSLNREQFLASRPVSGASDAAPDLPGLSGVKLDGSLAEVFAIALDYLGRRALALGEGAFGRSHWEHAIGYLKIAAAADPELAVAHYRLAWVLATASPQGLRDGPLAVVHSRRACELVDPAPWQYLLALALAEAEAGDFDRARKDLATALEKAPGKERTAWSFLDRRFENRQPYPTR